jgi:hypothetical protein
MSTPTLFQPISVASDGPLPEVICHGLLLASIAARLRVEWHAGLIGADTAMKELDSALDDICALRQRSPQRSAGRTLQRQDQLVSTPAVSYS